MSHRIITGDVFEVLAGLDPQSFDGMLTDPPYFLEFMGRTFDAQHKAFPGTNAGQKMSAFHEAWMTAALPALRPGANIVAASGSRVYHRLACGIENTEDLIADLDQALNQAFA